MRIFRKAKISYFLIVAGLVLLLGQTKAVSDENISHRIARLEGAISSAPSARTVATLLLSRSNLHRLRQDWRLALVDLEAARKLNPRLEDLDLRIGITFLEAGRLSESANHLRSHISRHPEDGFAWIQFARSMVMLEEYKLGNDAFSRAITLTRNPSPQLILEQADAIRAQGPTHVAAALESIEAGIETIGPAISLELRALQLERDLGNFDRALLRVSALADRARSKAPWLLRKGEILLLSGRVGDAQRTLENAKAQLLKSSHARRKSQTDRELLVAIEGLLSATRE